MLALQLLFIGWLTNIILFHLDTDRCPWCGQPARMEFVRGHYECSTCRRPIMDCCDGEQACPAVKLGRAVPRVGAIWTGAFPDQDGSESA